MRDRPFRDSLCCLAHPTVVLCIVLLLLNDHLFKAAAPSWITGKISDFAGLYFFPFLLAAVLATVLRPFRCCTRAIVGRTSFLATALWFVAAKATPWGHALTVRVVSAVLRQPASIVLDPTDLVALLMLWPAWRLWQEQAERPVREHAPAGGWPVLLLAVLATVATSPPIIEHVARILVIDQRMYALVSSAPPAYGEGWEAYETTDNGKTWSEIEPIPEAVLVGMDSPAQTDVGDPGNHLVRYRLAEEEVWRTDDGGSTWDVDWQIPPGRRVFMSRHIRAQAGPIDLGPYDMAFTPDGSGTLVVAAGTEGVLVREPSGAWFRYAVGRTAPTPYSTVSPGTMIVVLWIEAVVLLGGTFLLSVALSVLGWIPISVGIWRTWGGKKVGWVIRPGLVLIGSTTVAALAAWVLAQLGVFKGRILEPLSMNLFRLLLFLPILVEIVLLVIWSRAIRLANNATPARIAQLGCAGTTVTAAPVAAVPFVLWAMAVLPRYGVALSGALVLGLTIVVPGAIVVLYCGIAATAQRSTHAAQREEVPYDEPYG